MKTVIVTYPEGLTKAKEARDRLSILDPEIVIGVTGTNLNPVAPWKLSGKLCHPVKHWYDVYTHRVLTLAEIGCTMSHWIAWEYTRDYDGPVLYLEDDVIEGPMFRNLSQALGELEETDFDLSYLGQRFHEESTPLISRCFHEVSDLHRPWWTSSYVLSKRGRDKILSSPIDSMMCPADDYLPAAFGKHSDVWLNHNINTGGDHTVLSTPARIFDQRTFIDSTTERGPFLKEDPQIVTLTFTTDEYHPGYVRMLETSERFGFQPVNIGSGEGWSTSSTGGMPKVHALKKAVKNYDDGDTLLFVDGWDTMFNKGVGVMHSDYLKIMEGLGWTDKAIFASETTLWPTDLPAKSFEHDSPFKYLNSGVFIGKVSTIKQVLDAIDMTDDDDQRAFANVYLNTDLIEIDRSCLLFQCVNNATEYLRVDKSRGCVYNVLSKSNPSVVHFNGPSDQFADSEDWRYVGGRFRDVYGSITL